MNLMYVLRYVLPDTNMTGEIHTATIAVYIYIDTVHKKGGLLGRRNEKQKTGDRLKASELLTGYEKLTGRRLVELTTTWGLLKCLQITNLVL